MAEPLWVWICGPFAADGDAELRVANLARLNKAALDVFSIGHVPIIGINMALPMMQAAGLEAEAHLIRRPLSQSLMRRCDAVLRVAGASIGADREVAWFVAEGRRVLTSIDDLKAVD